MGNNHNYYFGKEKRKLLVLGLPSSGKTTIIETMTQGKTNNPKAQKTKDLNIQDAKIGDLFVTFFEVAGGERQRIFWKQHYEGTQAIVFLIDCHSNNQEIETSLKEIAKLESASNLNHQIPIAVCLHKSDLISLQAIQELNKKVQQFLSKSTLSCRIFETTVKNSERIKDMISWVLGRTKPL